METRIELKQGWKILQDVHDTGEKTGLYLPPFFQKTNKLGVQKNILYVQGIAVTVLSLLFVVMPSVQSFYQILSQLTVILYLIMYMLMFSGAIALRYKMKKLNRPFRIGKGGNGLM